MRFNLLNISLVALMGLSACTNVSSPDGTESNIVGQKLKSVSSLTTEQGSEQNVVAMYDETVQKIHQFDLSTGKHIRSLTPSTPGGKHFELYNQSGNYVVDLTTTHISIFNQDSVIDDQPIQFAGTPVSAAFHPSLGLLVIYDDLQSVGMIQLDGQGNVSQKWVGGPLVKGDAAISAGDIDDQGRLILALSGGEIAVVDLALSMKTQSWQYTSFSTTLSQIEWVAPVHDQTNQILVRAGSQIALIDVSTKTILSDYSIDKHHEFLKSSKIYDGHILVANIVPTKLFLDHWTVETSAGSELTMIFAQGSQIHTRRITYQTTNLLTSRLNLAKDTWSLVDTKTGDYETDEDLNIVKQGRTMSRYAVSSMLAKTDKLTIADEGSIEFTEAHIFELFPSKLGYATNTSISTGEKVILQMFNKTYMK